MPLQKLRPRNKTPGSLNRLSIEVHYGLAHEDTLSSPCLMRNADGEGLRYGEKPAVKGSIMQKAEAKSILRVQSVSGVHCPWNDVTGDQNRQEITSANATEGTIAGQYTSTEEVLIDALLGHASPLGISFRNMNGIVDAILRRCCPKLPSDTLAFSYKRIPIPIELIPHSPVCPSHMPEARNALLRQHGVEGVIFQKHSPTKPASFSGTFPQ
jgi:hypothetical protein